MDGHLGVFLGSRLYTPQCLSLYLSVVEFHIIATAVTVTAICKDNGFILIKQYTPTINERTREKLSKKFFKR